MTADYLKLEEAPTLIYSLPQCSACCTECDSDGAHWICPTCGTSWNINALDGAQGDLFEAWAGETLSGPVVPNDAAWREAARLQSIRRETGGAA